MFLAKSLLLGAPLNLALAAAAYACPCPDKPQTHAMLAPQVVNVARSDLYQADIYQAAPTDAPAQNLEFAPTGSSQAAPRQTQPLKQSPERIGIAPPPAVKPQIKAQINPQSQIKPQNMEKTVSKMPDEMTIENNSPAAAYTAILKNRISSGADGLMVFDYADAKSGGDLGAIQNYVRALEAQNPNEMSDNEAIAYWANLYNAVTLKVVLENYPVKSIRKIGGKAFSPGPWKEDRIMVNGKPMSLDDVEHKTLRKQFPSPYIHYMVNCASVGCPNLLPKLWEASTLEAERKAAADAYINSPRGVMIKGDKLVVSNIYKWFEEDFGGKKSGVLAHLREHAGPDLAAAIDGGAKISGYDYDWNLNE